VSLPNLVSIVEELCVPEDKPAVAPCGVHFTALVEESHFVRFLDYPLEKVDPLPQHHRSEEGLKEWDVCGKL
jgi:hypothetical protein